MLKVWAQRGTVPLSKPIFRGIALPEVQHQHFTN
jgi:hypothetical protein